MSIELSGDTLFQITAWCDDETLSKLCLLGLCDQISSFSRLSGWWTARISNLLQISVSHSTQPRSWKNVYHSLRFALFPNNQTWMENGDPYARICYAPLLRLEVTAIEILLAIRDPTDHGYRVLIAACGQGWIDPEDAITEGHNPLDSACINARAEVVKLLLADPRSRDESRSIRSCDLMWYLKHDHKTECMNLILDHYRSLAH